MYRRGVVRGLLSSAASRAGVLACALAALGGCGSVSKHTTSSSVGTHATSARPSVGTAYADPEVAVCMQRNGVTILSNGELQVSKTLTAAKRKALEKRCGFGVAKGARPIRKPATKPAAAKSPPRQRAKQPESFRSHLVAKLVACLHNAGVNIPRSDSALLSSTSGIRTRSPQVKAAIGKCRSEL
jgi:hypothetical protein